MMNCNDYEKMINKLLDGELLPDESTEVFAHIAGCGGCREFYHRVLTLNTSLDRIADRLPIPPGAVHQLPRVDIPVLQSQSLWNRRVQMRVPVFAMIIIVFAITLGVSILQSAKFSKNETIYVTTLPAVNVTAESRTIHPIQ